jgi:hypothetical protein
MASAAGVPAATAAPYDGDAVTDLGVVYNSTINYHGCKANMHDGWSEANQEAEYVRAVFDVGIADNGYACQGWLQRSTDSGAGSLPGTWTRLGDVHTGGVSSTAWYFNLGRDDYTARVCVGTITANPNDYTCGFPHSAW